MWEGSLLPSELGCDCQDEKLHHTNSYQANAITKYAREYPAGTSSFFYTDFQRAFVEVEVPNGS